MEIFEAIAKRHSYRAAYTGQPVPRADLERIVQAGIQAPSGRNDQTTTFVIVDDPALVAQIAALPAAGVAVQTAQAYILCITPDPADYAGGPLTFYVEDCAAATENMMLALTALGYASVWIDGWLRRDGRARAIGALVGLPADKTVRILMPIGVPAEQWAQREKKPFAQRAWFNRYGE